MTRLWTKLFFILIITLLLLFSPLTLLADENNNSKLSDKLGDIETQIKETEAKISALQEQERTLSSQIDFMDSQIKLTTLKISQNKEKIVILQAQIEDLGNKIFRLEESLDHVSAVLLERISQMYRVGKVDPLILLLSSEGFSDFISRLQYLRVVQIHDKKLLVRMETTKGSYKEQKNLLEEKKKQVVALKKQLEGYQATLAQQKKDKESLLELTRNDEKRFQEILAALRAEQDAIQKTISQAFALLKDGTPIEKGAEIALMGNSGWPNCSSGTHLHFEIRKDSGHVNPAGYLKPISSDRKESGVVMPNFSGDWDWPIDNPWITQEYGETLWTRQAIFGYRFHTGIDMRGPIPNTTAIIRAPKNGTLYKGSTNCGSATLNYVAIDHGEGLISWYWHVK